MSEEEKSAGGSKPALEKESTPELKVTADPDSSTAPSSIESAKEPARESTRESTKESTKESDKGTGQDSPQSPAREQTREHAKASAASESSTSAARSTEPAQAPVLTPQLAAEAIAGVGSTTGSRSTPQSPSAAGGIGQRRSPWESSLAALRYIGSISRDDELRVRDSDRATSIFLLLSSILTVLSLLLKPLAAYRLPFVLVCDVLVGAMLVFYVINRFGIINTLTPRQALLTWQLMMGSAFIGIFMTINMAVVIALAVANTSIDIR